MKITDEINNYQDIIDSRDIIERIADLRGQFESLLEEAREDTENIPALAEWLGCDEEESLDLDADLLANWSSSNEANELNALEKLAEEASGYSEDWEYGATLIRESYFEDYAQELAEDTCDMGNVTQWPFTCIDWTQAAKELAYDYTTVDFDGVDYYIR